MSGVDAAIPSGPEEAVARTAPRHPAPAFAAVDLGSNNCRLLVARPAADGFRVIDAFSRIVRLGEGVYRTGRLSEEAMDRTLNALRVCANKMRRRGVGHSRAVATEACRRAANFGEFAERVRAETGLDLELITSEEEARLAVTGCSPLLDEAINHALMFDIGGGSTELMWIEANGLRPRLIDTVSLPFGVVTLSEQHGGDKVPVATYDALVGTVMEAIGGFESRHDIRRKVCHGQVQMLGSSGTVTTLAGVFKNLPRYDRSLVDGSFLDFPEIHRVSRALLNMDFASRAAHPCIGRERADLVVAGCAVLEAICLAWPVGRLRIADRGVREGILLELMTAGRRRRRGHGRRPARG
jgi:exopolyphosphatase/guanosine-5'-triphosphate,3'-diphosphate pyrophosphatase